MSKYLNLAAGLMTDERPTYERIVTEYGRI